MHIMSLTACALREVDCSTNERNVATESINATAYLDILVPLSQTV